MPRYRDPQRDALDVAKLNQGGERIALDTAKFYQSGQQHADAMSLEQQRQLLAKETLLFNLVKARQETQDKAGALAHGAAIIQKMGDLNVNSPSYETERAKILAEHAPGLTLAKDYVKQKDSVWEAQTKASRDAFTPINVGRAAADLKTAVQGFDSLAQQFIHKGQPIPQDLQDAKTNFTKYAAQIGKVGLTNMPGQPTTASTPGIPTSAMPTAAPAPTAAPVPTATPTPATAIATDDATKFLQSLGVGPQANAGTASSGLPDEAEQSLTPETDDETEES